MDDILDDLDDARMSGDKTEERIILEKLKEAREEENDIVTYEGFMEALGIEEMDW